MNSPGFCCRYSQKLHKMAYQLSSKFFQARCIHFVELLYFLVQPAKQELHRWMKPRICLIVNDMMFSYISFCVKCIKRVKRKQSFLFDLSDRKDDNNNDYHENKLQFASIYHCGHFQNYFSYISILAPFFKSKLSNE